jgi:hypothetical protein
MVLDVGEKVHVMERRLFDTDMRRHFFGVVEAVGAGSLRATGYVFVYDPGTSGYVRADEPRTRVIPTAASGFVINVAPSGTEPSEVRYETNDRGRLVVTDGGAFTLDINEFGRSR